MRRGLLRSSDSSKVGVSETLLQILFYNFLLSGLAVAEKGVLICKDSNRRPSGEGYCVFVDEEAVAEALKRDNASMGHRLVWAGGL